VAHRDHFPSENAAIIHALRDIRTDCSQRRAGPLDSVIIRSAYGGRLFTRTTQVDAEMLSRFATLASQAPMHVPHVCQLAQAARTAFGETTVNMAFETAFFVDLPDREQRYGIADDQVRRFGYHGLYHQAASNLPDGLRPVGATRTLSLCLEPQPEVAAIIGHRPVLVTSGATPLEGLPGETTCGELDPTIVLTLARRMKWGPEQVNDVLTRQSGIRGLLGRDLSLGQLLAAETWPPGRLVDAADGTVSAAANILAYRILLAGGASVAAMGGLDRVVLSGRYAQQGHALGQWLCGRLSPAGAPAKHPLLVRCAATLPRILADQMTASSVSAAVDRVARKRRTTTRNTPAAYGLTSV
jgi:acetate kinase